MVGFPHQLNEFPFPSQLGGTRFGARMYTGTCSALLRRCALEYLNQTENFTQQGGYLWQLEIDYQSSPEMNRESQCHAGISAALGAAGDGWSKPTQQQQAKKIQRRERRWW